MKAIWSGSISFGLVNIPVTVHSAIKLHAFGFRILHAKCNTPLIYERWCPHCKKEIGWKDTVKGLKQKDGSFIVLTKEQIEELKPEKTDTIDIISFIPASEIHTLYLQSHYYIAPKKKNEKSFFLFQRALQEAGTVAIGRFIMKEKEYVCAINPYENGLTLNTLNYSYEIRDINELPTLEKIPRLQKTELDLAKQLIKKLTKKTFHLSKYKDTFIEKLKKAIKKKPKRKPKKAKIIKLKKEKEIISALKASLRKPSKRSQPVAYAKGPKRKIKKK